MKKIWLFFIGLLTICLTGCKPSSSTKITSYDGIYKFVSYVLKYEDTEHREAHRAEYNSSKDPSDPSFDERYPLSMTFEVNQNVEGKQIPDTFIYCIVSNNNVRLFYREEFSDPETEFEGSATFDANNFVIELPIKITTPFGNRTKFLTGSVYIQDHFQYLKSKIYDGEAYYSEEITLRKSL